MEHLVLRVGGVGGHHGLRLGVVAVIEVAHGQTLAYVHALKVVDYGFLCRGRHEGEREQRQCYCSFHASVSFYGYLLGCLPGAHDDKAHKPGKGIGAAGGLGAEQQAPVG